MVGGLILLICRLVAAICPIGGFVLYVREEDGAYERRAGVIRFFEGMEPKAG